MRSFSMEIQLKSGQAAEDQIVAEHPDEITKDNIDGRAGDCILLATQEKLEIKKENYKYAKAFKGGPDFESPNAAIEKVSVIESGVLGGPWKAKKDGCRYYIHYWPRNNGMAFVFDLDTMIPELEEYIKTRKPKEFQTESKNKNGTLWHTMGYRIPAEHLSKFKSLRNVSYKDKKLFP